MPSMRHQIHDQALEIQELKRQRHELRRLNALLEGDPAVVKFKAKIRKANQEALIVKEALDRKEEEVDEKEKEIEELKEELDRNEKEKEDLREEHEGEMDALKAESEVEKEAAAKLKEELEKELKKEKGMAKFYQDELKKSDQKNVEYLVASSGSRELANTWKQKAAGLNQQLLLIARQATNVKAQMVGMQREVARLQEIITSHTCTPPPPLVQPQSDLEVQEQLRAAKAEVEDYQKGINVMQEMLRTTEAEYTEKLRDTETRHEDLVKSIEEKHAEEIQLLNNQLEYTCGELQLAQEKRRSRRSFADSERALKRKREVFLESVSRGMRAMQRGKEGQPLSDLNLP